MKDACGVASRARARKTGRVNRLVQMDCSTSKSSKSHASAAFAMTVHPSDERHRVRSWKMRALMLMTVLLAAEAGAICTSNLCQCRPADFTAVGVLHSDGGLTLEDARWADGGVAVVDAGRFFATNPYVDAPIDTPVVIGARSSETLLPIEAWPLTDAGLVACQGGAYSLAAWRQALDTGSCADLTPGGGPCHDTRPCSTTAGLSLLATIALLATRSTRRLRPARGTAPRTPPSSSP